MEPKFNPFTGVGRRLDGKPAKHEPSPLSSSPSKDKQSAVPSKGGESGAGPSSQSTNRQSQGKLVFGSNASRVPKDAEKVPLDLHIRKIKYHYHLSFDSL